MRKLYIYGSITFAVTLICCIAFYFIFSSGIFSPEDEIDLEIEKTNGSLNVPYNDNGSLFDLLLNDSKFLAPTKEDNESDLINDDDSIFYRKPLLLNTGGAGITLINYPHPPQLPPSTEQPVRTAAIFKTGNTNGRFEKINSTHDYDPLLKTFLDWSQYQTFKGPDEDAIESNTKIKLENGPKITDIRPPVAFARRAVQARQVPQTTWRKGITKDPISTRGYIAI